MPLLGAPQMSPAAGSLFGVAVTASDGTSYQPARLSHEEDGSPGSVRPRGEPGVESPRCARHECAGIAAFHAAAPVWCKRQDIRVRRRLNAGAKDGTVYCGPHLVRV